MKKRDHQKRSEVVFSGRDLRLNRVSFSLIALMQVVCPLLFFTNLTRNPYYTQIALLNVLLVLLGACWVVQALKNHQWEFVTLPFQTPLFLFLGFTLGTTFHSWIIHSALRSGIVFEGTRVLAFTIINCFIALYGPLYFSKPSHNEGGDKSINGDLIFILLWGAAWFWFHSLKDPDPAALLWDNYGALLWIVLIIFALRKAWDGRSSSYFRLIFIVAAIAGLYGILQYRGRDIIWSSPVTPYGGRPVSTFGNPNFLSSYVMMIAPLSAAVAMGVERKKSWGYWLVSAICVLSALSTLTRSSYVGLLAAFSVMGIFLFTSKLRPLAKKAFLFSGIIILLIVLFPKTPVTNVQSPLARFTEIADAFKKREVYYPWHQRLLIWSSAWDMVKEQPLLGKGWGCFELFYPFYQGRHLFNPDLAPLRTHANNAHNVLLEFLSQVGIIGTGLVLWIFVVLVRSSIRAIREATDDKNRLLLVGLFSGIIGMVVDNFFGNVSLFFAVPAFLFWWIAGSLFNETSQIRRIQKTFPPFIHYGMASMILFLLMIGGVYSIRRWNQERYYFEGFKFAKADRIPESVKSLEKAFDWFPGEVNSNYELGNSYARYAKILADQGSPLQGKNYVDKSLNAYKWALKANPGYDEIYFNLGIIQLQNGQEDEAVKNLEIALLINPLLESGYGSLGNVYLKRGDSVDAIRVFKQGAELHPLNKDYWNNLGYAYVSAGKEAEAFDAFKKAVQADPGFQQAWVNLANVAQKTGKKDPILQVPALIKQMESAMGRQDYRQAKIFAENLVALLPDSGDSHLSLGNILFYLKDNEGSVRELEKAIALRPNFPVAHVNAGKILLSMGKVQQGRDHLEKALTLNPGDEEVKKILASLRQPS